MFDVAHVQFPDGGLVMPADSPYDRQLVRERVATLIPSAGTLQLAVHGYHWTVTRPDSAQHGCTTCAQPLRMLRCWRDGDRTPVCIECVLGSATK